MSEPIGSPINGLIWLASAALAMVLTAGVVLFLVSRYPVLESKETAVGLCVFFFIIFFDFFAIPLFIGREYRAGEGRAAIGLVGQLFLWGILAASVLGPLAWLATKYPGVLWVYACAPLLIPFVMEIRRRLKGRVP